MSRLRVLTICHNHPSLHPGGTEIFAYDLFREMKRDDGIDALFLACTNQVHRERRPGTAFQTIGRSADEIVLWAGHFDRFFQSQVDLHGIVPELSDLLVTFAPDVVHFHHSLLLGVEMLFLVRRVAPQAKVVFTLHDYYPICANDGQMVKTKSHELCRRASPDACHACYPEIAADKFLLREKHIKAMFSLIDVFIAPSQFLRERYVSWGLPAEKIVVIRNGQPAVLRKHDSTQEQTGAAESRPRRTFGYFGNLNPYKGILIALAAVRRLADAGEHDFSLQIHGGMPFQTEEFRHAFDAALQPVGRWVTHHGPYRRDDLPDLMNAVDWVIVPSIWWENAPLVIQEAFRCRRPVLCSGIGGMAEAVRDGIDGLHFRAGDAHGLMTTMRRVLAEPDLWSRLVANLPVVPTLTECLQAHLDLYLQPTVAPFGATRPGRPFAAPAAAGLWQGPRHRSGAAPPRVDPPLAGDEVIC